jgi:hypothetical protein
MKVARHLGGLVVWLCARLRRRTSARDEAGELLLVLLLVLVLTLALPSLLTRYLAKVAPMTGNNRKH